jgi:hypothetical protein
MATIKHILKRTYNEVQVLVAADAPGTVTVNLATDLAIPDVETTVVEPTANLTLVHGAAEEKIVITRNSAPIFAVGMGGWGAMDLGNCDLQNTHDVVVVFSGAGSLVLTLRKVSGYGWVGINGPEGPQPE